MTYPPDDHRDSNNDIPIEQDRRIINGSMLAVVAFIIIAVGIAWYALTEDRSRIASFKPPAVEHATPNDTTGYGGPQPKAPSPK